MFVPDPFGGRPGGAIRRMGPAVIIPLAGRREKPSRVISRIFERKFTSRCWKDRRKEAYDDRQEKHRSGTERGRLQLGERTNYHTHTARCKDALGTEMDYCRKAVENGFTVLGFTDHCAWPYKNGFVSTFHMDVSEVDDYVEKVNAARDAFAGRLEVHLGWECEYYPEYMSYLAETKERCGLAYLILCNHFDTTADGGQYFGGLRESAQLKRYVTMCTRAMKTGLYTVFAHPDLFLRSYPEYDRHARSASRELCLAAKALNIPIEYNLLGLLNCANDKQAVLGYPARAFWETAAEVGVTCMIGVDAHSPERLDDIRRYEEAEAFLDGLGLKRITRLPL